MASNALHFIHFKKNMTMDMITELSLRLGTALLLGGVIGVEREWRSKDAGFRTHFLVALGSAFFVLYPNMDLEET